MSESVLLFRNSMDSIPADKVLKMTQLDLQKRFPIYHACPQMLGGPSLQLGIPLERQSLPWRIGWSGNDSRRLVTWESFHSVLIQHLENILNRSYNWFHFEVPCILPINSKIVSWSSTTLRLAIVTKVELWNHFNSSISLRLLSWTSRNSEFCCKNCAWRSCLSRRWSSSACEQWSSSCWDESFHSFSVYIFGHNPETSREVVEETLLLLQESQYYPLLELVAAVSKWMFISMDFLQGFWFVHLSLE